MPFLLLFSFIITGVLKAELITIKALLVSGLENNNIAFRFILVSVGTVVMK